ncbi:tape measure protein [Moraxella sp. ZY210820]|uniref:tape measure protein n=1 Tax=Moraxella sp. ZY210820 TaxID=2904123 RepID=UPI002730C787|nr:tape measure protein [Moraxella sp. ZY210820]WLF84845.1 tape measure protein [Moraxella sp. ZY210820]
MSKELSFKILLEAETGKFVQATKQSEQSVKAMFEQIKQQSKQTSQEFNELADEFNQSSSSITKIERNLSQLNQEMRNVGTASEQARSSIEKAVTGLGTVQNALGAIGIGATAMEIANTADAYAGMTARIKLAIGEHGNLEQAMQNVQQIAIDTTSNLEETANLYAKLSNIGKEIQLSNNDVLTLTKTINQAIAVSGGSAETAQAGIQQLGQALMSGTLRGDEFNSMMENSPRLARALADGLNVPLGKLRELSSQGKLTSDVVTKALLSQAETISKEYAQMPTTISDAMENLKTQWTVFIGEMDKGSGASAKVVQALTYVSQNLIEIADTAMLAGQAFLAWKLGNIAYEFYQKSKAIQTASVAIQQETTAVIANTQAQLANARATQQANIAQQGMAVQSTKNAQAISTATQATSTSLMGLVGRLGHLGIAITALGALVPTVLQPMGEAIGEIAAKTVLALNGEEDALKKLEQQQLIEQRNAEFLAKRKQEYAQALAKVREQSLGLSADSKKLVADFDALKNAGKATGDALKEAFDKVNLGSTKGINDYVTALNALQQQGKATADEIKANLKQAMSGQDLIVFQTNAKAAFMGTAQEAQKMALITEQAMILAVERTGLSFEQLKGHGSQASRALVNDTQIIINSLDQLKMQGIDTGMALNASFSKAIQGAETEQQLGAIRGQIRQMKTELGETVSNGLLQQVEQQSLKIKQNLDQVTAGINSVNEAFSVFGLRSRDEAKLMAENYRQAFEKLKNSGQATTDQLKQAFQQYADVAIQANGGIADSALQSQGAMLGLSVKADETGKSIIENMQQASQSVNHLSNTAYNATGGFDALVKSAENAIAKSEEAIEKATQAGEKGGKLGTTTRTYYSIEAITNELKNKGYDDAQAYAKAQEVFYKASKQMLAWAGSNNLMKDLANNAINRHGVTAEAMYQAMKKAGEQAVAMNAQKALQEKQAQQQKELAEQVKQIAPTVSQPVTPHMTQSVDRVVKLQFDIGGKTAELMGTHDNANSLEAMFQQLEMLKRRS